MQGDIETAAQVLDQMNSSGVEINVGHITSAMRACWEASGSTHHAADFLFGLLLDLELQPDIAVFTCLVGAYKTAPVEKLTNAYATMKDFGIKPDFAFAETYLGTLLRKPKEKKFNQPEMIAWLHQVPMPRIAAAKVAMKDFQLGRLKLTSLSRKFVAALQEL